MKQRQWIAILILGVGAGILISAVQWLLEHSILRKGQWTFVPYVLLIAAAAIYARRLQLAAFGQRFALFFWPIVIATLISWVYLIVQAPGYVAILTEMIHDTRIIPLDGRPHLPTHVRQWNGDGRGHWEGDTLVVETTNFKARSVYRNANPDALRLVERFTRTSPDRMEWRVTVDDATTWTRPWTFSIPLTTNDREQAYEYACHEGNYGLRNILSAARAADKEITPR